MLVLSRREGEKLVFPNLGITLEVVRVRGSCRSGLASMPPQTFRVWRGELCAARGLQPLAVTEPKLSSARKLTHAIRNRLHAATLGLHLYRKQMDRGLIEEADRTWRKILEEFVALEG